MRRLTRLFASLSIVGLYLAAGAAFAGCQIDTKPVAFGTVDVTRENDITGEIVLTCPNTLAVEVGLASGAAPGQRYMTGPNGGQLKYELHTTEGRQVVWSDGSGEGTTVTVRDLGGNAERLPIYGRVPQQPAVPPGTYSDSLTVLVSFF